MRPCGDGYSWTSANVGLRAGSAPAATATAFTSAVLPAPSSPESHPTDPGARLRHSRSASCASPARLTRRRTAVDSGTTPPHAHTPAGAGRAARGVPHGIATRLEVEELVADSRGQLEIELGRRLPHLA